MAVTRLKRKHRKNKARAKQRVQQIKLVTQLAKVKSPHKEKSGLIEEGAPAVEAAPAATPEVEAAPVAEATTEEAPVEAEAEAPKEETEAAAE